MASVAAEVVPHSVRQAYGTCFQLLVRNDINRVSGITYQSLVWNHVSIAYLELLVNRLHINALSGITVASVAAEVVPHPFGGCRERRSRVPRVYLIIIKSKSLQTETIQGCRDAPGPEPHEVGPRRARI